MDALSTPYRIVGISKEFFKRLKPWWKNIEEPEKPTKTLKKSNY
jgi:hypothetical protein